MSITTEQAQTLSSGKADVYAGEDKVGRVGQIYLDDTTGAPSWVTVKTGLFGAAESFVPLEGAELDGDDVVVSFDGDQIKNAPRVESDGQISADEEAELYRYYGLSGPDAAGQAGTAPTGTPATDDGSGYVAPTPGADPAVGTRETDTDTRENDTDTRETDTGTTVGRDTSGPTTDDAMTRSEERVDVSTQTRESGRARLRKYVTSETVSQTVPVRHEEVTLTREPITDANVGSATAGPTISEEEHEVVLHEEVPVVEKVAVPVERIQLGTETVTEDATIATDVDKEQVELVDPATAADDRR